MLPRPLSFVRAVRGRTPPLSTMTREKATPSRLGRGSRQTGERRLSGSPGRGRDWMLWAAMGLTLLTILSGLANIFLP
jgi:hypothetical protein